MKGSCPVIAIQHANLYLSEDALRQQQQTADIQARLETCLRDLTEMRKANQESKLAHEATKVAHAKELEHSKARTDFLRLELDEYKIKFIKVSAERDRLLGELESLRTESDRLVGEIGRTNARSNAEKALLTQEKSDLASQLSQAKSQLDLLRCDLEDARLQLVTTDTTSQDLREQIDERDAQIRKFRETLASLLHGTPERAAEADAGSNALAEANNACSRLALPTDRKAALSHHPSVSATQEPPKLLFTRSLLTQILGGSPKVGLIVSIVGFDRALSAKWGIQQYLCPRWDHHPWAPTKPGEHGYLFAGPGWYKLGNLSTNQTFPTFVGREGCYCYGGNYVMVEDMPVSRMEWEMLSEKFKRDFCKVTALRDNDLGKDDSEIRRLYDSGDLLIPCYMLKCVEFNAKLNEELKTAAAALQNAPQIQSSEAKGGKKIASASKLVQARASTTAGAATSSSLPTRRRLSDARPSTTSDHAVGVPKTGTGRPFIHYDPAKTREPKSSSGV